MTETASAIGTAAAPVAPALEARNVTVLADGKALISSVSLSLRRGELVALIGPSGGGKTTLLGALSGSGPVHGGTIERGGLPPPAAGGVGTAGAAGGVGAAG